MDLYNVKLIEFGNGMVQIRRYSEPVLVNLLTEEEKDARREKRMMEKHEHDKLEYELNKRNPFTEDKADLVEEFEILSAEEIQKRHERSVRSSLSRTVNKLYELSRANEWEWFLTFTFRAEEDRYDYDACCKKLRKWLNHVKDRYSRDMKYLIVPELHKDGKGWHFHGLFDKPGFKFEVARNNDKESPYYQDILRTSYPDGDYIYNVTNFNYGFTTATQIKDSHKASNYIMKYVTKDLCQVTKHKSRYFHSMGLKMPEKANLLLEDNDFEEVLDNLVEIGYRINYRKEITVENDGYANGITYYELAREDIAV